MSLYSIREYTQREEATGVANSGVNSEEQGRDSGGKSQNDGCTNGLESSFDKKRSEASGRSSEKQCLDRINDIIKSLQITESMMVKANNVRKRQRQLETVG